MVARPNVSMRRLEDDHGAVLDLVGDHGGHPVAVVRLPARGDATEHGGAYVLAEFDPARSLLDLIELEEDRGTSRPAWTPARREGRAQSSWIGYEMYRPRRPLAMPIRTHVASGIDRHGIE